MSEGRQMHPELQSLCEQIEAVRREAETVLDGLTEEECAWQPTARSWSISQCFEHLNVIARHYLPVINQSINEARAAGLTGAGPYRYGWLENWLANSMEPPPRRRFRAPRRYVPPPDRPLAEIRSSFFATQERLLELLQRADGVDLGRARVSLPGIMALRFSLGRVLALLLAHERRHLWQAAGIRNSLKDRQAE